MELKWGGIGQRIHQPARIDPHGMEPVDGSPDRLDLHVQCFRRYMRVTVKGRDVDWTLALLLQWRREGLNPHFHFEP